MRPERHNEKGSTLFDPARSYQPGQDPATDAWYTAFFIENHLDHSAYPTHVASPEQVRFMVYAEQERYFPCSDRMFYTIIRRENRSFLEKQYEKVLHKTLSLVDQQIEDSWEKAYLNALIKTKYQHETRDGIMIPSRLEKRLLNIYLNRTQIEDPCLCEKAQRNVRALHVLKSEAFCKALDHVDGSVILSAPVGLEQIKARADYLKLRRLFALSVESAVWESDEMSRYTADDYLRLFGRPIKGDGVERLWQFLEVQKAKDAPKNGTHPKKILWLANEAGEIMVDMAIIKYLARLGHKIVIALKDGPLFTKVDLYDAREDEKLSKEFEGALFIDEKELGKNELVNLLKSDKNIMAISDGTREELNLLLTSTTFGRVFKEVDAVISKGPEQRRRLFDTHFTFTQDIYNISKDETGSPSICFKVRHPAVIKFTHKALEGKAQAIIAQMQEAKDKGMTVMFYSGIIGSIPGKEAVAKKIMSTYVQFIREQSAKTFIINPSEHSEPGMDADDLMFMWEIVQRSGLIDIWRFETYDDIVKAFRIMKTKVPPEWVGKDATFSTGCTKEMKVALEVQEEHPEMQIIGPSQEKFLRRQDYGIGKMYDRKLDEICSP
jgi:hypothetical protein